MDKTTELMNFDFNSISNVVKYDTIGTNEEYGLVFKKSANDYKVEGDGESYFLTASTVDELSTTSDYDISEVLSLMYLVYSAYDSYEEYLNQTKTDKDQVKVELEIVQDNLIEVFSRLITKYSYDIVSAYISSMPEYELIKMFDGKDTEEIVSTIDEDLTVEYDYSMDSSFENDDLSGRLPKWA